MTAPITNSSGTATIGAAEFSLTLAAAGAPAAQTTAAKVTPCLDCSAMAAAERFDVTIYEKVAGGSQGIVESFPVVGPRAIVMLPTFVLMEGWDVTIKKISGLDRTIGWSLRLDQNDGPATLAAIPSAATIATAVWATVLEGTETAAAAIKNMAAVLTGPATGLDTNTPSWLSKDGLTVRVAGAIAAGIRTITTRASS